MSSRSARFGHVRRKLTRGEALSGGLLELALELVGDGIREVPDPLFDEIARKLKAGTKLDDYEQHLVLDMGV